MSDHRRNRGRADCRTTARIRICLVLASLFLILCAGQRNEATAGVRPPDQPQLVENWREVRRFKIGGDGRDWADAPDRFVFSLSGRLAASSAMNGVVRVYDLERGGTRSLRPPGGVTSIDIAPDDKHIVTTPGMAFSNNRSLPGDNQLKVSVGLVNAIGLWDLESTKVIRHFAGHSSVVYAATVSADGRHILSASYDQTIRLWDFANGKELKRLEGHTAAVSSLAITPDNRLALSGCWVRGERGSADSTVRLWDLETGEETQRLEGHSPRIRKVMFSPDASRAVTQCLEDVSPTQNQEVARLWDLQSGKLMARFVVEGQETPIAFSADGRLVVSAENNSAVLRDAEDGKELRRLNGHDGKVTSVAVSPDGRRAVSGGSDGVVRVWDIEQAEQVASLRAHRSEIYSVSFSHDNRRVVSRDGDSLIVWERSPVDSQVPQEPVRRE